MRFEVWGLESRICSLGFRVLGWGVGVKNLGLRVWGEGLGLRVWG